MIALMVVGVPHLRRESWSTNNAYDLFVYVTTGGAGKLVLDERARMKFIMIPLEQ